MKTLLTSARILVVLSFLLFIFQTVNAQKRDHLNAAEDNLIREAESVDIRMKVYVRAIERRLLALTDPQAAQSKEIQKEISGWGELPKGTRLELMTDIKKILEEAIGKLDDVFTHEPENKLLFKAVRYLASEGGKLKPQFVKLIDSSTDDREKAALMSAVESVNDINDAIPKLPAETKKKPTH